MDYQSLGMYEAQEQEEREEALRKLEASVRQVVAQYAHNYWDNDLHLAVTILRTGGDIIDNILYPGTPTCEFYEANKQGINVLLARALADYAKAHGLGGVWEVSLGTFFNDHFLGEYDEDDPLCLGDLNQTGLVWWAVETLSVHIYPMLPGDPCPRCGDDTDEAGYCAECRAVVIRPEEVE